MSNARARIAIRMRRVLQQTRVSSRATRTTLQMCAARHTIARLKQEANNRKYTQQHIQLCATLELNQT